MSCNKVNLVLKFWNLYHSFQIRERGVVFLSRPWCFHVHGDSTSAKLLRPDMHFFSVIQFLVWMSALLIPRDPYTNSFTLKTQARVHHESLALSFFLTLNDIISTFFRSVHSFVEFVGLQFTFWNSLPIVNYRLSASSKHFRKKIWKHRKRKYVSCMHDVYMHDFRSNIKFLKKEDMKGKFARD